MEHRCSMLINLDILILCGGFATRINDKLDGRPKILANIAGKTFLELQLDVIRKENSYRSITYLGGYKGIQVREVIKRLNKDKALNLFYFEDRIEGQGTAQSLFYFLKKYPRISSPVILYGDSIPYFNINSVFEKFLNSGKFIGLTYIESHKVNEKSNIKLQDGLLYYDKEGVKKSMESETLFTDYGVTFLNRDFFMAYSSRFLDLGEFIHEVSFKNPLNVFGSKIKLPFLEIGNPESLDAARRKFEIE